MLGGRRFVLSGLLVSLALLCWFFPLFHIRKLGGSDANAAVAKATGEESEANSQPSRLEDYAKGATEVLQLWEAFDTDAAKAKKQFGQQAGLGGAVYFCVRGSGTVESITKDRATVLIPSNKRRVCLELGIVVDSTVRDAVGVKASKFPNSQEFNAFSSELNRQVEDAVLAPNRELVKEGAQVDFVGCGKVGGKSDLDPLSLVPILLKVSKQN